LDNRFLRDAVAQIDHGIPDCFTTEMKRVARAGIIGRGIKFVEVGEALDLEAAEATRVADMKLNEHARDCLDLDAAHSEAELEAEAQTLIARFPSASIRDLASQVAPSSPWLSQQTSPVKPLKPSSPLSVMDMDIAGAPWARVDSEREAAFLRDPRSGLSWVV